MVKGIANRDGKLIAKAVIGTAAAIGGYMLGARIGTAICPVVGTIVVGWIFGIAAKLIVDEVIIENF